MTEQKPARLPSGVRPSAIALAHRRAERAGLDLDALARTDPEAFLALHAEEVLVVDASFVPDVDSVLERAFEGVALYRVAGPGKVRILALPMPNADRLRSADDDLARWVSTVEPEVHAFYRIVSEPTGDARELGRPVAPDLWDGGAAWVGPFPDEEAVHAWARARVGAGWVADAVAYRGVWFCDVFSGHEGWLEAR